jgi:deoxyribonuclease-1
MKYKISEVCEQSIGELNATLDKPKNKIYGECKFEIDFDANRAYVKDEIKGDISMN